MMLCNHCSILPLAVLFFTYLMFLSQIEMFIYTYTFSQLYFIAITFLPLAHFHILQQLCLALVFFVQ